MISYKIVDVSDCEISIVISLTVSVAVFFSIKEILFEIPPGRHLILCKVVARLEKLQRKTDVSRRHVCLIEAPPDNPWTIMVL